MATDELSEFEQELNSMDAKVKTEFTPSYKVLTKNKIAVSKKEGSLWRDRISMCVEKNKELIESWKEIKDIYMNNNKPSNDIEQKRLKLYEQDRTYENLLWTNTNGINRETIMKLPSIEITEGRDEYAQIVQALKYGINNYMSQVGNNGLNCKEKLKKVDIGAQLTNRGIWRLDWNDIVDQDKILEEIKILEARLSDAKTINEIQEIEGELYAANEKLESSGMSGAQITLVEPENLLIDPNSQLESGLDADWMIEVRTEFEYIIKAKYGEGDGTVYAGDKSNISGDEEDRENANLDYISGEEDGQSNRNEKFRVVKTYYVWDRLKKRVYLYQDGRWDYPLWVWEDPYHLKRFFPFYILSYNRGSTTNNVMSEVSYYIPLMNSINKINSMMDKARDRAFNVSLVDRRSRVDEKTIQNITNGKPGAVFVDVPENKRLEDMIRGMPTPGAENQMLMNKLDLYAMMQKMSSADNLTRGEEYKTNTTNMAISQYSGAKKTIIGVRVDAIMSFYCDVAKDILQMMIDKFSMNDWLKYVSPDDARLISSQYINVHDAGFKFSGDDTIEPTSAMKKQEAMQLAQALGQFSAATPAVTIVMLKVISRAFNEVVITSEDWQQIFNSLQQQMQPAQQQMPMPNQPMPPAMGMPQPPVPTQELINQAAAM